MVERWTPEKWTHEWSMSRIRTPHTLTGYPAMLNQAFMTLHLEAFPWPQSSLVTLLQSRRCSSGWASNSLPRSGGMLSCIGALGKAWTKWSSPKLRAIWMALCLKISSTRKQAYEDILRNMPSMRHVVVIQVLFLIHETCAHSLTSHYEPSCISSLTYIPSLTPSLSTPPPYPWPHLPTHSSSFASYMAA